MIKVENTVSTNEILQENHYYPFGMAMNGPWMDDVARNNQYQYNALCKQLLIVMPTKLLLLDM